MKNPSAKKPWVGAVYFTGCPWVAADPNHMEHPPYMGERSHEGHNLPVEELNFDVEKYH